MKRILAWIALGVMLGAVFLKLHRRWQEEHADHRLMLLVDWSEAHDQVARLGWTDETLLKLIRESGANGILLGASTVQDFLFSGFRFADRQTAEETLAQLTDRGLERLSIRQESGTFRIVSERTDWDRLKDIEAGFDRALIKQAHAMGLRVILRVNNDPWLDQGHLFAELRALTTDEKIGVLLNTDEIPGGKDALPEWKAFLAEGNIQVLFDFHPTKATSKLGYSVPQSTWRGHTIPVNELKDLTIEQQHARWRRAVEERSCRILLIHFSPADSLNTYLFGITTLRQEFSANGWQFSWPLNRSWQFPRFAQRQLAPIVAFLAAIFIPIVALRVGTQRKDSASFARIILITLLGACVMAALADNPLTRLEIVPFRGIKVAFMAAWVGSFLSLYSWEELRKESLLSIRRLDVALGLIAAALIGYILLRMGNASAAWKPGGEQLLRDHLENLFVARPRFKEFAFGYPLLLLGLNHWSKTRHKSFWSDGRLLIGLGMMGPISMVNTFCHLHSPLYLALWRSANGIVIGAILGVLLVALKKPLVKMR